MKRCGDSGLVSLAQRGTSGERVGERGNPSENAPPLPAPLLPPREEREDPAPCPPYYPSIQRRWGQGEGYLGNMRSFSSNVFKAFPSPRPSPHSSVVGTGRRRSAVSLS